MFRDGLVEDAVLRLGITTWGRGDELRSNCPMHKKRTGKVDDNPSWSINAVSGAHNCFSCGYKGNLVTLVSEVKELDYEDAKSWIYLNLDVDLDALSKQLEDLKESYIPPAQLIPMSEARLAVFTTPPDWALEVRHLTEEACKKYGVLWNKRSNEWILPIREPDTNKLIGWQEKGQVSRSFFNRPAGVPKSKTMFGLDAWQGGTMIVVESPLDAVRLESAGITGGVAIYGAIYSDYQIDLMRRSDKLIFAIDNPAVDAAGKKSFNQFLSDSRKNGLEFFMFNYTDSSKDIGDMSDEAIRLGVDTATHCVLLKELK